MDRVSRSHLRRQISGERPVPFLSKLGLLTVVVGLGADLLEHTVIARAHVHGVAGAGFSVGEQLAHLVFIAGIVLVLVGVIVEATCAAGRASRMAASPRDAIR